MATIYLNANESPFNLSEESQNLLCHALRTVKFNRYPDPAVAGPIEAFADYYGVSPDLVIGGNGSDELLMLLMLAYAGDKRPVALSTPDFSMYDQYAALAGVQTVKLAKGPEGRLDPAAYLAEAKAQGCGMLLFSNPCNPLGSGLLRQEVLALAADFEGLVVVDEAYMDFWDQTVIDKVTATGNLAVLRTASKAFGLAALRLGFGLFPKEMLSRLEAIKSPYNVNSLSQLFGTLLYGQPDHICERCASVVAGREKLQEALEALLANREGARVFPSVTNFIYFEVPDAEKIDLALQAAGIVIRRFGAHGLRVTCGLPEENDCFLEALAAILRKDDL
ncbi:pyridoxal phosphate-dependent aminotransferase [Peptococcus niger]|uniref:histidinol-phosphate transaminase n=1 Tax=Peptococcus niger TaxID=2741 RepID=A0A1G6X7L8_PEPNI|nr:histidinol-phosphate transaminase [Peptococcus niger]SDD74142.1 histidinol-phosphate aminotransferase [Peptococcus niger]